MQKRKYFQKVKQCSIILTDSVIDLQLICRFEAERDWKRKKEAETWAQNYFPSALNLISQALKDLTSLSDSMQIFVFLTLRRDWEH